MILLNSDGELETYGGTVPRLPTEYERWRQAWERRQRFESACGWIAVGAFLLAAIFAALWGVG